jgi:hypothetical protein
MTDQPRRPRQSSSKRQPSKVSLTYYRSKSKEMEDKSPFLQNRPADAGKFRRFVGGVLNTVLIAALLAGLVYGVLVSPDAKVNASSESFHSTSTYQQAAQKDFQKFGNRNKITLNEQAVAESLQKQFPEIAGVYVELPVFSETPVIHLNIAEPSFMLNDNGSIYIVDSQGLAVAQLGQSDNFNLNSSSLKVITDKSGFTAKSGQQVMSSSSVQFLNGLIAELQHAHVPIKSLTLPPQAQELDLQSSDRPYYVKFYMGGDVLRQTGQFLATRHQLDATNAPAPQYLDVRVPGKVFYK